MSLNSIVDRVKETRNQTLKTKIVLISNTLIKRAENKSIKSEHPNRWQRTKTQTRVGTKDTNERDNIYANKP